MGGGGGEYSGVTSVRVKSVVHVRATKLYLICHLHVAFLPLCIEERDLCFKKIEFYHTDTHTKTKRHSCQLRAIKVQGAAANCVRLFLPFCCVCFHIVTHSHSALVWTRIHMVRSVLALGAGACFLYS